MTSPWRGFDVIVVPDDDAEAKSAGFPEAVLDLCTKHDAVMSGNQMLVRETVWLRIKHAFDRPSGKLH
jgi:hypothetical protein